MLQIKEHAGRCAWISLVDQHGAAAEEVSVTLEGKVKRCVE